MSEEAEKEARAAKVKMDLEARARLECDEVIKVLSDHKDGFSGAEDDVDRTIRAKDLAAKMAVIARSIKAVEADLPLLRSLRLTDVLVGVFKKESKAREWVDMVVASKSGDSFSTVCSAVATGLKERFAVNDHQFWMTRIITVKLEDEESPEELMQRLVGYNIHADGKADAAVLLNVFVNSIRNAGDALVASAMEGTKSLKEAAAAAQVMWAVVRKVGGAEARGRAKAKVAAVSLEGSGHATMEVGGCYFCGKRTTPPHVFRNCPEMPCRGCGTTGHMLSDCNNKSTKKYSLPSTRKPPIPARRAAGARRSEGGGYRRRAARLAATKAPAQMKSHDKRLFARVVIGGMQTAALLDMGAECSVISSGQLKHFDYVKVRAPFSKIEGLSASGAIGVICGARTVVVVGSISVEATLAVVDEAHVPDGLLLGVDVLEKLGLMDAMRSALAGLGAEVRLGTTAAHVAAAQAEVETEHEEDRYETTEAIDKVDLSHLDDLPDLRDKLRAVLHLRRMAFLRDGRLPEAAAIPPVVIRVDGPPVIVAQRPWSAEVEQRIAEHERLLVKDGVARWVDSSAWRGEPLLVWKPDGTTRYTGDYRKTNRSIVMDAYPTASLPEELRRMAGGKIFSSFDFRYGFWQIPVARESQETSTQRSAVESLLVFERLPMGYNTSPALFTRAVRTYLINVLHQDVRARTALYMDDLGHSSEGERRVAVEKEIAAIDDVLRAVVKARFALGLRKCNFAVTEMVWCGFHLSSDGRRPDPDRTRAFLEMGTPANKAELGRWLGVSGALRTGVRYYAQLAAPLYKRMHKAAPRLVVSEDYLAELDAVREAVRSAPPLQDPVPSVPLTVEVDGSTIGYGAVLWQNGRMCATASRQKSKTELNYGSFDNEWSALVFGVDAF